MLDEVGLGGLGITVMSLSQCMMFLSACFPYLQIKVANTPI